MGKERSNCSIKQVLDRQTANRERIERGRRKQNPEDGFKNPCNENSLRVNFLIGSVYHQVFHSEYDCLDTEDRINRPEEIRPMGLSRE